MEVQWILPVQRPLSQALPFTVSARLGPSWKTLSLLRSEFGALLCKLCHGVGLWQQLQLEGLYPSAHLALFLRDSEHIFNLSQSVQLMASQVSSEPQWCNKYILVSAPLVPGTVSKTLGISWVVGMTLGIWGLLTRGTNLEIRELEHLVPFYLPTPLPHTHLWGEEAGDWVNHCWPVLYFNQSCLHNETSITTLNHKVQIVSGLLNGSIYQEAVASQLHGDRNCCALDPSGPFPMYFVIWLLIYIPYNILYNKLAIVSNVFPWILWAVIANYLTWGGSQGNPWFCSQVRRKCG